MCIPRSHIVVSQICIVFEILYGGCLLYGIIDVVVNFPQMYNIRRIFPGICGKICISLGISMTIFYGSVGICRPSQCRQLRYSNSCA